MREKTFSKFPVDNSAILYLSLMRADHCNSYRFSMTLTQTVCPQTLQTAVNRIYRRFPTVIAGFRAGIFQYYQIPAEMPPQVQPDPDCLITMTREEIRSCAFRIYYREKTISIEAFHALADGFGAIACFTTLVAEYLRLKHGISIPVCETLLDPQHSPTLSELEDAYLEHAQGKPLHLPSRYAYQLPKCSASHDVVYTDSVCLPADAILETARAHGVSITTLLSAVMAASVMEVQQQNTARLKPVRIMVPVDLRRMFPSRTLRNFILYVLPTLEAKDRDQAMPKLLHSFSRQMLAQLEPNRLASIMAYNVQTQNSWYFRFLPMSVKLALMRLIYRYFGESNSSLTLTNLGNVRLPKEMQPFVAGMEVTLTPRARSPYNCAILSYNGQMTIQISRFPAESPLKEIFQKKLNALLTGEIL